MNLIDADALKEALYQQWFLDILLTQTNSLDIFHALEQKIDEQPKIGCSNHLNPYLFEPCPFCGCNDRRVSIRKMGNKGYKIICGKCGGAGPYVRINDFAEKSDAQKSAKRLWNRRAGYETD